MTKKELQNNTNLSFEFRIKTFNNNETKNAKSTTKHILLAVTGSVAVMKSPSLIDAFSLRDN